MTRRVYIPLSGGLGNQLFQFYAGMYFAEKYQSQLTLLRTPYGAKTSHGSSIVEFDFAPGTAEFRDLDHISSALLSALFSASSVGNRILKPSAQFWTATQPGFMEPQWQVPEHAFVRGYFQSHKYFLNLGNAPHPKLNNMGLTARSWAERARQVDSVAIHIRLGDYKNATNQHGVLSPDYFVNAINKLRALNPLEELWVFSDSPSEAIELLQSRGIRGAISPELHEHFSPPESLMVMKSCRSFVLANSTFSFWAAMLSNAPASAIARPSSLMKDGTEPRSFYPPQWLTVESSWV